MSDIQTQTTSLDDLVALSYLEAFFFAVNPKSELEDWEQLEFLSHWNEGAWPELLDSYPDFDQNSDAQVALRDPDCNSDSVWIEAFNQILEQVLVDDGGDGILLLSVWLEQRWQTLEDEFTEFDISTAEQQLLKDAMSDKFSELVEMAKEKYDFPHYASI